MSNKIAMGVLVGDYGVPLEYEEKVMVAAIAITKGNTVKVSDATELAAAVTATTFTSAEALNLKGKTVNVGEATAFVFGVALETVTAGQQVRIQTYGPNQVAMVTTSSGVAEGEGVYGTAAGACDGSAISGFGTADDYYFGLALAGDSGDVAAVNTIFLNCWGR